MPKDLPETMNEIAKRRGLYWLSYEIYGGQSGYYTYGDLGTKLKRNIENAWRSHFTRHQNILEIEAPIINPEIVFEASGHIANFREYSSECTKCRSSFRADHLIEEKTGLENVEALGGDAIKRLLAEHGIKCPRCGSPLKEPTLVLTMFKTEIGATGGVTGYARPEAAQSMFINFRRGYQHAREKLPFALAQVGKVMRNEISPRRGLTRVREFTIMELELFFDPQDPGCPWLGEVAEEPLSLITETMMEEENTTPIQTTVAGALQQGLILTEWQAYFMGVSQRFITHLGVPPERQRFRAHLPAERAHYSAQTYDHEVEIEGWGWTEVAGHAYRTDYDLKAHQDGSAQDMTILREDGTRVVPHVVEPSFGLDRVFLATLMTSYERRKKRNILRLPRNVAPIQAAVFPLVTKDGLPEKAQQVHRLLIDAGLNAQYDDGGSVGRRYARADEAGTPLAVTIDYDTLEDETVTLRDRDTWTQVRTPISQLTERLKSYLRHEAEFTDLGTPL